MRLQSPLLNERQKSFYLSLGLHTLLILLTLFSPEKKVKEDATTKVEITLLDTPARQIVTKIDSANNQRKPKEAKYLWKKDQTVKKEVQSHKTRQSSNTKYKQPKALTKQAVKKKAAAKKGTGTTMSLAQITQLQLDTKDRPSNSSNDSNFLKNIQTQGSQTLLNTRKFAYAHYYERIQNQLEHLWQSDVQKKMKSLWRQGRYPSSHQELVTKLVIALDKKGQVRKLFLLSKSGETSLDHSALDAFKKAGPFPNPPQSLVQADGYIYIYWNFVVEA